MNNSNLNICESDLSNYRDLLKYQYDASRTINLKKSVRENLKEHSLALCEEAGEVASKLKKFLYHGHDLDIEQVTIELGDLLWELSAIGELLDIPLNIIAQKNIVKLKKRYPDGFQESRSINREV